MSNETTDTPRTDSGYCQPAPECPNCKNNTMVWETVNRWKCNRAGCHSFIPSPDTPRTDAVLAANSTDYEVLADFARELEREITEIRNALGDDGRRTHKEFLVLSTKASQWREWKEKYIHLRNAHMAEGQDPAGTIWEHADKIQKELKASKAEVERLKEDKMRLTAYCADLLEELSEIKETYASIVQQPHFDEREVHCSCVPALRAEVERLNGLLNDLLILTEKQYWNSTNYKQIKEAHHAYK